MKMPPAEEEVSSMITGSSGIGSVMPPANADVATSENAAASASFFIFNILQDTPADPDYPNLMQEPKIVPRESV